MSFFVFVSLCKVGTFTRKGALSPEFIGSYCRGKGAFNGASHVEAESFDTRRPLARGRFIFYFFILFIFFFSSRYLVPIGPSLALPHWGITDFLLFMTQPLPAKPPSTAFYRSPLYSSPLVLSIYFFYSRFLLFRALFFRTLCPLSPVPRVGCFSPVKLQLRRCETGAWREHRHSHSSRLLPQQIKFQCSRRTRQGRELDILFCTGISLLRQSFFAHFLEVSIYSVRQPILFSLTFFILSCLYSRLFSLYREKKIQSDWT